MHSRKTERGSGVAGLVLALTLVIFVAVTVYIFAANVFPMAPSITRVGDWIDSQYNLTLWITGVIFVMAQLGLAWMVFRYRDRGQKARFVHGNNLLEVIWTSATFVLFIAMGAMAVHAWSRVHFVPASSDALQIDVMAEQFTWNFRYAGPDGRFAPTAPENYSDANGNPFGINSNSKDTDDIVSPILEVPVGRQIELNMESKDVIHSFYVRELRIKQDIVPGMDIPIHFTPLKIGTYDIMCAQLCGLGHYQMHSTLHVVSEADFQKWLKQQEAENQQ
ncbi:MAG TPA: cytochrome c oxidase subunit II [Candidatus Dormibacteraeota bacterium]|nr:cytochrome c oxidase subunit II [Candidatus Dormibacteraeota bacterium]